MQPCLVYYIPTSCVKQQDTSSQPLSSPSSGPAVAVAAVAGVGEGPPAAVVSVSAAPAASEPLAASAIPAALKAPSAFGVPAASEVPAASGAPAVSGAPAPSSSALLAVVEPMLLPLPLASSEPPVPLVSSAPLPETPTHNLKIN